jgi:hypothetical protein
VHNFPRIIVEALRKDRGERRRKIIHGADCRRYNPPFFAGAGRLRLRLTCQPVQCPCPNCGGDQARALRRHAFANSSSFTCARFAAARSANRAT